MPKPLAENHLSIRIDEHVLPKAKSRVSDIEQHRLATAIKRQQSPRGILHEMLGL
jgi:hypothetical protein